MGRSETPQSPARVAYRQSQLLQASEWALHDARNPNGRSLNCLGKQTKEGNSVER